ncbi:hypothetical protein GCM10010464_11220 [Pseudonocardia yunnanensis]|uniref:IPT/TIG domain-containing protein n=1 Tax=Pseudonocardia yunnanensis TaxID=58107 RepID=A0ABW4F7D4_9PSEU
MPTVLTVVPSIVPTTGGTVVTITGSGFIGATAVSFGGTPATTFTVNSDTQITATTPARAAGIAAVTVTGPTGTSNPVNIIYQGTTTPPTITSIAPSSGPTTGGTVVTITGSGFTGATAVSFGGTPATTFTVNSATQITATTPAHAAGAVQVTVTAPTGTSNAVTFAYQAPAAPVITSIVPSAGPTTGGTIVTITGSGFTGATAVSFGGTPATTFTVNSATQITATTPAHAAGVVQVTVTGPGGTSNPANFAYQAPAGPIVSSVVPSSGPTTGGTVVTITGSGFTGATAVTFGGTPATSFMVNSATQITATTPVHAAGTAPVVVTTPSGSSNNNVAFFYLNAPVITGLSPDQGPASGGTVVTITGTGFAGATSVTFGGTLATAFTVDSDTQITATAPAHAPGTADVVVTAPGGTSTGSPYAYVAAPVITTLAPNAGPQAGGTSVTISGAGLTFTSAVQFGANPAAFTVLSDSQIVATAPAGTGTVQVTVTTPGGVSNGLPYEYVPPPEI